MKTMWIIFSGSEENPVVVKIIQDKSKLLNLKLEKNEWIEEFDTVRKK